MIIMKFGGTSVEDAASIRRVAEIIRERIHLKPVVVVSAMGKTTRKLLEAARGAAAGEKDSCSAIIQDLQSTHEAEAQSLAAKNSPNYPAIDHLFDELERLLGGLAVLGEVPPRGLDKILAYGELLSSAIVASALKEGGINSRLLDSRELIKTDNRFGGASPIFELTNIEVNRGVGESLDRNEVPVLQGFIGSTREGATTTLGFEGSDYTASIVGAALNADDIQIWKDVPGLMTADPRLHSGARTVKLCSFTEAAELTFFGAKVLHPKAIHPAARANIPVHIFNSKQPSATGTEIRATAPRSSTPIKSIAYKRPVTLFHVTPDASAAAQQVSANEFLRSLLLVLNRHQIDPVLTAVSASSIAVALDARGFIEHFERDLVEELKGVGKASAQSDKAIVSIVGEELRDHTGLAADLFQALDGTSLPGILRGSSPIAMNLVVDKDKVEDVVKRLHAVFFKNLDPVIFD